MHVGPCHWMNHDITDVGRAAFQARSTYGLKSCIRKTYVMQVHSSCMHCAELKVPEQYVCGRRRCIFLLAIEKSSGKMVIQLNNSFF